MQLSFRSLECGVLGRLALTLFLTFFLASSVARAEGAVKRDLTVEQSAIADIGEGDEASSSKTRVSARVDHEDRRYRIGDKLVLQVKASQNAYITVLDVATSGKVYVVFPNRQQRDNHVQANDVLQIPAGNDNFSFVVNGPEGREVLKVFATDRPLKSLDVNKLSAAGPYYSVPGAARSIARDLSVELKDQARADYGVAVQVISISE
jgi:hypothetical protein